MGKRKYEKESSNSILKKDFRYEKRKKERAIEKEEERKKR